MHPQPDQPAHAQDPYGRFDADLGIKCWIYAATLQLRTPLSVLVHHGEIVPSGHPRPEYGNGEGWEGIWVPCVWSVGETRRRTHEMPMASQIGQIPAHGEPLLSFLKEFRQIIEDDGPRLERVARMRAVLADPRFAGFVDKLPPHTADGWAVAELAEEIGVWGTAARTLFDRGKVTGRDVWAMSDAELLEIPRLGAKTLAKIRAAQAMQLPAAEPPDPPPPSPSTPRA